jgi:hypothetical protein
LYKGLEIFGKRATELFVEVVPTSFCSDELEEWYFKIYFHNFMLDWLEQVGQLDRPKQPNVTTIKQQEQIWRSLQKYGWTYPILTNKDGTLVDGEQRKEIYIQHGEFFTPILRLPVTDVDRRILRQILNKLKGKHNKELDAAELDKIEQGAKSA